jgi:hypothetical protein
MFRRIGTMIVGVLIALNLIGCGTVVSGNSAWVNALEGAKQAAAGYAFTGLAVKDTIMVFVYPASGGYVALSIDTATESPTNSMLRVFQQAQVPYATLGEMQELLFRSGYKIIRPEQIPQSVQIALATTGSRLYYALTNYPQVFMMLPLQVPVLGQCGTYNPCYNQ